VTTPSGESEKIPDPFDEALGRIIKVIRTDLGLERGDLADRAGISYSYLAAIENGQRRPSSVVLRSIAEALGLRTHLLVESAEARVDQTPDDPSAWHNQPNLYRAVSQSAPPMRPTGSDPGPADDLPALIQRLSESDRAMVRDLVLRLLGRSTP
jgi:transcriptional regulator with XRE-family HTH domain